MDPTEVPTLDVLIVEDDPDTCANLEDILTLDGHRCTSVGNFADALARLPADGFSAVIVDRQLPDGTADVYIPRIKAIDPELPIVVVTGYPNIDSAIESLRLGAYDYLLKPVNAEVLRASLRRIAERRRYVDQLREQRDFAESVIEMAQAIVLLLDREGRIVRYNSFMEELSGVPLAEVRGEDWFSTFLKSEDRASVRAIFMRILAGERIRGSENALRTRRGSVRSISWSATPLLDPQGSLTGVLAIGHDITDLRSAQEKMVRNERLAAIGEMVTGLAHESRNAFQRSQACLEMLALDLEGKADSLLLIGRIQSALDHLRGLYEQVRSYAAPIALQRQAIDPLLVARQTWGHLESARQGRAVTLETSAASPVKVEGDPHQLEQVFRNLFENAIDACGEKGKIRVTASSPAPPRQGVRIEVHDNGPGIPEGLRQQIFEPFFTTKTRGTGLGMAISRRLIEAHGGSISVGSSPDGGALFVVDLPAAH